MACAPVEKHWAVGTGMDRLVHWKKKVKSVIRKIFHGRMNVVNGAGNTIVGHPRMIDSQIVFEGKGNILFFESDDICIENSKILFKGTNSVVIVRNSRFNIKLKVTVYNDSVFYIGKNCSMNNSVEVICSEARNVVIGDDGLFSSQCLIRTSDAHRIYDMDSRQRINLGRSVFVGDHCWLAARVVLLKGSRLHSGTIIGSDAVFTGKESCSNSVWGGNPAKMLRGNVFYDKQGTHGIRYRDLQDSLVPNPKIEEKLIFTENGCLDFDIVDQKLCGAATAEEKLNTALAIMKESSHNRFAKLTE